MRKAQLDFLWNVIDFYKIAGFDFYCYVRETETLCNL